jgi:thiol-disulfide isomerase/thioredoxin
MKFSDIFWFCVAWLALFAPITLTGCTPEKPTPGPCCHGRCPPKVKVIWFTAGWCQPCKQQAPEVEKLSRFVMIEKTDIDRNPVATKHFKVRTVPTYVVQVNGREKARAQSVEDLRKILGR